jgi:hypothetical protein
MPERSRARPLCTYSHTKAPQQRTRSGSLEYRVCVCRRYRCVLGFLCVVASLLSVCQRASSVDTLKDVSAEFQQAATCARRTSWLRQLRSGNVSRCGQQRQQIGRYSHRNCECSLRRHRSGITAAMGIISTRGERRRLVDVYCHWVSAPLKGHRAKGHVCEGRCGLFC